MPKISEILYQSHLIPELKKPDYRRSALGIGIAHLGVGNFHRAHQAFYTHKCLSLEEHQNWGICGIGILPKDRDFAEAFREQQQLYTLTECAPDGYKSTAVIGSILEYFFMPDNPEKAIERLADPLIKIVSLTITEGGYNMDRSGSFNLLNPDIQHDLKHPHQPKTVFGLVIEALKRRRQSGAGPFTLLSCDNLQYNGEITKKAFISFAQAKDEALADWMRKNLSFPNCMVDRITPATREKDRREIEKNYDIEDKTAVFCEDFIQWVLEDRFCAGRPQWEKAGALFTKDVIPYELAKLRLLNAAHSMLAYPAALAGFKYVHEAMQEAKLKEYLRGFMREEAAPLLESPRGLNLEEYIEKILERFSNPQLEDQLERICFDGASKLPVFVFPTLSGCLKKKSNTNNMAYLLACYKHFLLKNKSLDSTFIKSEPHLEKEDIKKLTQGETKEFLKAGIFENIQLTRYPDFIKKYIEYEKALYTCDSIQLLEKITL